MSDTTVVRPRRFTNPWESIAHRTRPEGDCIVWTGFRQPYGHGQIRIKGKQNKVHRWLYEQLIGPIPKGKFLDHKCRNGSCVKLGHLRVVSHAENMQNLGVRSDSSSGYRGVYWVTQAAKWAVAVECDGKKYHGGFFDCKEEANLAAIALRNKLFTHNEEDRV